MEFLQILNGLCGVRYEAVPFPAERGIIDIGDYYGDYSRFAGLTGWQPAVDLPEGMKRTLGFYREHKDIYWG